MNARGHLLSSLRHCAAQYLKGNVGVLFTNKSREEVEQWFQQHSEPEFARSGNIASKTVSIPAGE